MSHETESADFIRMLAPITAEGPVLSRGAATQMRKGIAQALGMSDAELSARLAVPRPHSFANFGDQQPSRRCAWCNAVEVAGGDNGICRAAPVDQTF